MLVVAASYLAARWAFDWLAEKYFVVSGGEYLLLGILLGPQVSGLLTREALDSFAPIITLALGWMGARIGAELVLPVLIRTAARAYRVALGESVMTLAVITTVMTWALAWQFDLILAHAVIPGVALGVVGTASAQAGVAIIARRKRTRERIVRQLVVTSAMNAVVAITAFGLLLSVVHSTPSHVSRPLTPTEWMVISLGIGAVGGTLFHLFLGEEHDVDRLFISLTGALVVVSGAATYLRLSPILAAMVFSTVLVNTTRSRRDIVRELDRVERPLYFVLLIFGGAVWEPSVRASVLPVVLFLALRAASKVGAARLASRLNGDLESLGQHWGRGLLGQGGLALAIAVNYAHMEALPLRNLVFTTAVASLLLTDLLSARFVRALLPVEPEPGAEPATGEFG